jgi:hypothetical protein
MRTGMLPETTAEPVPHSVALDGRSVGRFTNASDCRGGAWGICGDEINMTDASSASSLSLLPPPRPTSSSVSALAGTASGPIMARSAGEGCTDASADRCERIAVGDGGATAPAPSWTAGTSSIRDRRTTGGRFARLFSRSCCTRARSTFNRGGRTEAA